MDTVLACYMIYQKLALSIRKRLLVPLIYPSVLIILVAALVVFLVTFVISEFVRLHETMESALPVSTQLLVPTGGLARDNGLALQAVLAAFGAVSGRNRALPDSIVARLAYIASMGSKLLCRRNLNRPRPGPGDPNARRLALPISCCSFLRLMFVPPSHRSTTPARSPSRDGARRASASRQLILGRRRSTTSRRFSVQQETSRSRKTATISKLNSVYRISTGGTGLSVRRSSKFLSATGRLAGRHPLTPQLSCDNSNTGSSRCIFGVDRPLLLADPSLAAPSAERFFDLATLVTAPPLSCDNAGRNILTVPTTAALANHTNFDLPVHTTDLPTFERILSSGQARQLQLGLRFTF